MYGVISDQGARTLADCPDLRHLELLNVSGNRLTKAGIDALKATGISIQATHQHSEEESWEDEYLSYGDWE
jgi:hypothetical protein